MNTYRATDRRVYNGALSSDLRRERRHTASLEARMKTLDPTASVTYFPLEGKFLAFTNSNILQNPDLVGPPQILSGNFHESKQEAIIEAIRILERKNKDMFPNKDSQIIIVQDYHLREVHQTVLYKKEFIKLYESKDPVDKAFLSKFRTQMFDGLVPHFSFKDLPTHLEAYNYIVQTLSEGERRFFRLPMKGTKCQPSTNKQ